MKDLLEKVSSEMPEAHEEEEEQKTCIAQLSASLSEWQKLSRFNRSCDGGLAIATIVPTLTATIIGIEGVNFDDAQRKAWISGFGGLVVAIRSIGNAFPVKERAGGYRLLDGQGYTLKSKIAYLQSAEEISTTLSLIREDYYKLLVEASKIEA